MAPLYKENIGKYYVKTELDEATPVYSMTPYDEALGRNKEPLFMRPIRDWEREVGFVTPIIWTNVAFFATFHLIAIVWVFIEISIRNFPKWQTVVYWNLLGIITGFGVTAGVHRFWTHRSYKAKWPLQLFLLMCYSTAGQNTVYEWVRIHRVHHKFSETSADPHDANRGFFFSHVGWLMMKKHPDVVSECRKIEMSDITNDPLLAFHSRYFTVFKLTFCFVLPCLVPWLCWADTFRMSVLSIVFIRYLISLHCTWSVNSLAHLWGYKPYDKHIMPAENIYVSYLSQGEGWHNYHHTFPWDYKAAELGTPVNLTTTILDMFARIGWAYDMKAASPALVRAVASHRGHHGEGGKRNN